MYIAMKVLQINATCGIGSTGIITMEIAHECIQNHIQAYVAYPRGFGRVDYGVEGYEIGSWLDHKLHALLSRIAGKQAYFSKGPTRRLLRYIGSIKPDVVHLHNLHSNYIHLDMLLEYLAVNRIKTVITLHDCWFFTGGCFHYASVGCEKWKMHCDDCIKRFEDTPAYFMDASYRIHSDRIKYLSRIEDLTFVGVSEWIARQVGESRLKETGRITYIHNGFDLQMFRHRVSDLAPWLGLEGKFVILGPATKWLQAINRDTLRYFSEHIPDDAVLLLFGASSKQGGLPSNVRLFGYTTGRMIMAQLYSMADVMVNCSREDSLSSINIEAQACGTPVVTYDATGNRETVEAGFSVPAGDYSRLFEETMRIYMQGKEAYSDRSRRFVELNFDRNSNYGKYISLYR